MEYLKAIAKRIEEVRIERKISKYSLIKKSGLSASALNNILKGKTKNIKLSTINKIARGLGLTLKEFFSDKIFLNIDL